MLYCVTLESQNFGLYFLQFHLKNSLACETTGKVYFLAVGSQIITYLEKNILSILSWYNVMVKPSLDHSYSKILQFDWSRGSN